MIFHHLCVLRSDVGKQFLLAIVKKLEHVNCQI